MCEEERFPVDEGGKRSGIRIFVLDETGKKFARRPHAAPEGEGGTIGYAGESGF